MLTALDQGQVFDVDPETGVARCGVVEEPAGSWVCVGEDLGVLVRVEEDQAVVALLRGQAVRGDRVRHGGWACYPGEGTEGRALTPLGAPLDEGATVARSLPLGEGLGLAAGGPWRTGVPVVDLLAPVAEGSAVLLQGATPRERRLVLEAAMARAARRVLVCVARPRPREVAANTTVLASRPGAPPMGQLHALWAGIALAEACRGQGQRVVLGVDGLMGLAQAARKLAPKLGWSRDRAGWPQRLSGVVARLADSAGCQGAGSLTVFASCDEDVLGLEPHVLPWFDQALTLRSRPRGLPTLHPESWCVAPQGPLVADLKRLADRLRAALRTADLAHVTQDPDLREVVTQGRLLLRRLDRQTPDWGPLEALLQELQSS